MSTELEKLTTPLLAHRFATAFMIKPRIGRKTVPVPSPLDIFFTRVSGMERTLHTRDLRQGGDNVGAYRLPERIGHGNLVLERGVMAATPVAVAFDYVLSQFEALYMDVIVMVLGDNSVPVSGWLINDALPVRWQMGGLDASSSQVLISRMELSYRQISHLGSKQ